MAVRRDGGHEPGTKLTVELERHDSHGPGTRPPGPSARRLPGACLSTAWRPSSCGAYPRLGGIDQRRPRGRCKRPGCDRLPAAFPRASHGLLVPRDSSRISPLYDLRVARIFGGRTPGLQRCRCAAPAHANWAHHQYPASRSGSGGPSTPFPLSSWGTYSSARSISSGADTRSRWRGGAGSGPSPRRRSGYSWDRGSASHSLS